MAADESIWVRRWPPAGGDITVFDVFTRGGTYLHTVLLDRDILIEPTPVIADGVVVGAMRSRETDEFSLVRFTVGGTN